MAKKKTATATVTKAKRGRPPGKPKRKHFVPPKPYKDFPLTPHASGKWMKSIRGKLYYFGNWGRRVKGKMARMENDGWEEALKLFEAQAPYLYAGKLPPTEVDPEQFNVAMLCNRFLESKLRKMESGGMTPRTYQDYKRVCDVLIEHFGNKRVVSDIRPTDFAKLRHELATGRGVVAVCGMISLIKSVFKYGEENDFIPKVKYGTEFQKPSKAEQRKARAAGGKKLFTRDEILQLLNGQPGEGDNKGVDGATTQLRAMILLGINCGFGNTDCSELMQSMLDLKNGWVHFPRPKTGVDRQCKLWPETVEALKLAIAERPKPKDAKDADCVFLTRLRHRWVRELASYKTDADGNKILDKVTVCNGVSTQFQKLLRAMKINGRKGLGFYSLRHTFRTVADACKDFPAVRLVMGHSDDSMDGVYREEIGTDRLADVAEFVRDWLFLGGGGS